MIFLIPHSYIFPFILSFARIINSFCMILSVRYCYMRTFFIFVSVNLCIVVLSFFLQVSSSRAPHSSSFFFYFIVFSISLVFFGSLIHFCKKFLQFLVYLWCFLIYYFASFLPFHRFIAFFFLIFFTRTIYAETSLQINRTVKITAIT